VKLLEDAIGRPLFDRATNTLTLNEAGRGLLIAVREAMRIVDDALGHVTGDELEGGVGIAAVGELAQLALVPACVALASSHPQLRTTVLRVHAEDVPALLLRGEADVGLVEEALHVHADLRTFELAAWARSVYARSAERSAAVPRFVMVGTPAEPADDGWPASCDRKVVAWVPDERAALEICAHSELSTVAYDAAVAAYGFGTRVVRLVRPEIPTRTLRLVHRRPVGRHPRTDAVLAALRATVELARPWTGP
jgi:DNA-binding transcriptional LysR family regulator